MSNTARLLSAILLAVVLTTLLVVFVENAIATSVGTGLIIFFSLWVFYRKQWRK
ncbi:hypothetical protein G4V62_15105 [Bacillaceae bacterium SIJ1]|uniref:hypothetical protein n=1 Tax=Litoribacterium kuwaitense TaxID=1398745 RepID=UPI0013EDF5DF|nr:hypothetical protein [Litoribacterium kuwaitense]NGP46215.1 hypothetical protein [Litoribacterium kuwaitense]